MARDLVVITGATGYVGFNCLRHALLQGYRARIVVRSQTKADQLAANPTLQGIKSADYTFFVVPDFAVPDAFDEAVQDARYVIHCAAPVPIGGSNSEDLEKTFFEPSTTAITNLLTSCKKSGTVKRIAYTSSAIALVPFPIALGMEPAPADLIITGSERLPDVPTPLPNAFVAYAASKIAGVNTIERWMAQEKPNFDVQKLFPTYVIGRDYLATQSADLFKTSNSAVLRFLAGEKNEDKDTPEAAGCAHADDVGLAHVKVLDPGVPDNESFVFSTAVLWNDFPKVTAERFPEAVRKGLFPNTGTLKSFVLPVDNSKIERLLGIKLKGAEEMVDSLVGQYIEFLEKEQKA
ncbi:hypothetical protein M8818_005866 [Zalaria obscura]|uniref:Uncharacterized protein n=1 Tax=Zalaria obscura TaxID=2024903 RepID=A0ACC3S7N1_9PEZI